MSQPPSPHDNPPAFHPDPFRKRPRAHDAKTTSGHSDPHIPDELTSPPSYPPDRSKHADQNTPPPPAYPPLRSHAAHGVQNPRHSEIPAARTPASASPHTYPRPSSPQRESPQQIAHPSGSSAFPAARKPRRPRRARRIITVIAFLLVVLISWFGFLLWDANSHLGRTHALSGAAATEGSTYLLAGSDSRADGAVQDGFEGGERSDSIMLVNVAPNGQAVAVSIPRDTFVEIPDYGWDKINASYAYGGSELLVKTVENLTGLNVDHYVQVGMGGVSSLVDALGGVELCSDLDVNDAYSGLVWEPGCHRVDGTTALAFSRMRYSDPQGDIGRTMRQRQVISKVISRTLSPTTLINPSTTLKVERAGAQSFTVDEDSNVVDVARLVLAFRSASTAGLMGTPPIATINYTTDSGASAVLLRNDTAPDFFAKVRSGSLDTSDLNSIDEQ